MGTRNDNLINWKSKDLQPRKREEQIQLAIQAQAGDQQARDLLITSNMKLASTIAGKHHALACDSDADLASEAFLGLCEAVNDYDPKRGILFSTFAAIHINKRVKKFVAHNSHTVRVNTTQNNTKAAWNLSRARHMLQCDGVEPTVENLAKFIDVPESAVKVAIHACLAPVNLDAKPIGVGDSSAITTNESIIPNGQESQLDRVERHQLLDLVRTWIAGFRASLTKEIDQVTWDRRVMQGEGLKEIGESLGCNKQYINVVEKKLIERFKTYCLKFIK